MPDETYRLPWSVYRWLEGETATDARLAADARFAVTLAGFLRALHEVDAQGGPPPGKHNFFRGAPLTVYHAETRSATSELSREIDAAAATAVWEEAVRSRWERAPVWVHGDVASSNLLVRNGRLSAVIDFGCSGVGDPACDLTIAWTLLEGEGRARFRDELRLDPATWARARGWALWKALVTLARLSGTGGPRAEMSRRVIGEVIAEHFASS